MQKSKIILQKLTIYCVITLAGVLNLDIEAVYAKTQNSTKTKKYLGSKEPYAINGYWCVFTTIQDDQRICYLTSTPQRSDGNYTKRGVPYITITNIMGQKDDEISIASGYLYKESSMIDIEIDKKRFTLFPNEALAWTSHREDDKEIINHMKTSKFLSTRATSSRDSYSRDLYSLHGFWQSYKIFRSLCV